MKHLIKDITLMLGVILMLFGFSMCEDRPSALIDDHPQMKYRDTAITLIKQFQTLDDIANHLAGSQDSALIMARALTIAPGEAWTWITDPDSLISKGFAILSQNKYNRTEWVVTDTAMRGFISIVANDSIALSMSISNDSLIINDSSILLTAYRDTLNLSNDTLYISGNNYVLLSSYLDNTDSQTLSFSNPNLSISGGNSVNLSSLATATSEVDTAFVYILSGQSNADGRALNSAASAGELDASTTVQIWNRATKQFEALNIGAGNNEVDPTYAGLRHGLELGLSENLSRNIYLIKHATGGKAISQWNGAGAELDTLLNYSIRPAIDILIRQGKIPFVTFLWHQGESDAASQSLAYAYLPKLEILRDSLKNIFGGNIPFIAGTINETDPEDIRINDVFRYLDGENFFRVAELDWQAGYRADALHLNYDGWKANSLLYLAQCDSLYPGFEVLQRPVRRQNINITSATPSACGSNLYDLTIGCSYTNLYDSIIVSVLGTNYAFWQDDFTGSTSLVIEDIDCYDSTGIEVFAYMRGDTIISDYATFNSPSGSTILTYNFANYSPPTTDATLFEDVSGTGHQIAIENGDTMIHNQSGEVTSVNPAYLLKEVPISTTDIQIDFTLYAKTTSVRGLVYVRADTTGVLDAACHLVNIRADLGDVLFYVATGNGGYTQRGSTTALPGGAFSAGEERMYRVDETGNTLTIKEWTGSSYTTVLSYTWTGGEIKASGGLLLGSFDGSSVEENAYFDDIIITF